MKQRLKRPSSVRARSGGATTRPCQYARDACATTHGRAYRNGVTVHPRTATTRPWFSGLPRVRGFCLRRTAVQPYCTVVLPAVFLCFVLVDARGFLEPLTILEITLEVFLSIKNQGFLLRRRQNEF